MICPHCGRTARIPDVTLINVETYRDPKLSVTGCCGKGVVVRLVTSYDLTPYDGPNTQDAWGHKLKRA